MKPSRKFVAFMLAAGLALSARAEPLLTVVGFAQGAYDDGASSEIVVKITRVDQDPATENEQFTVECTLNGGTAVENVDYRVQGLGKIVFPPGVREQSFSVQTMKSGGADKTLLIGLSNPIGATPVVTGENPVAQITIINQR
jgi:hypothetical protein